MSQLTLSFGPPCYVCDRPTGREACTSDYIGLAHNACLNGLSAEKARRRQRRQAKLAKEAERGRRMG